VVFEYLSIIFDLDGYDRYGRAALLSWMHSTYFISFLDIFQK
jgi:hypothetical protein